MPSPRSFALQADDGTALAVTDWLLEPGSAQGGVVLMHGLGEHHGRYAHVAAFFNAQGWSVRAYDHRGHGQSGGARGDAPDDLALLRDGKVVVDDFARVTGSDPLLFGHSMGGLFAAAFACARLSPLHGLVLSSPALAVPLKPVEKILLKVLGALAPGLGIPNGVKSQFLSHDPAVVDAYNKDPLVHNKISARLLHSMLAAIAAAQGSANTLAIPTLMLVAGDDRLVDASGSQAFYKQLPPALAQMHWYSDLYHEIFNEVQKQRVFDDLRPWLAKQAAEKNAA